MSWYCVDVLILRRWCIDVLTLLTYWLMDIGILTYWFIEMLTCGDIGIDMSTHWYSDVVIYWFGDMMISTKSCKILAIIVKLIFRQFPTFWQNVETAVFPYCLMGPGLCLKFKVLLDVCGSGFRAHFCNFFRHFRVHECFGFKSLYWLFSASNS